MNPVRFTLHFHPEQNLERTRIVNYWVYGVPMDYYRLDEHPERNFASVDDVVSAMKEGALSEDVLTQIRAALEARREFSCEVTEAQAEALGLGF